MDLCKYRNIFGSPGSGVHSYRIFNLAIVDVAFTIIGAYFIAQYIGYPFHYVLPALFLLGIIMHRIFCVQTTVDLWLFQR